QDRAAEVQRADAAAELQPGAGPPDRRRSDDSAVVVPGRGLPSGDQGHRQQGLQDAAARSLVHGSTGVLGTRAGDVDRQARPEREELAPSCRLRWLARRSYHLIRCLDGWAEMEQNAE